LGGLSAKVKDDHAVRSLGLVSRRPNRCGRVEGDLEIGLNLGIVRRQDAVAGIRRLAVDCLTVLSTIDSDPLRCLGSV
jgi:hypothetical protein